MRSEVVAVALAMLLAACPHPAPAPTPSPPTPNVDPVGADLRIRIARAEARRGGGVAELAGLARAGAAPGRTLALRGLGRIGGAEALAVLTEALADRDPTIAGAAAAAIGIAASLDDEPGDPPRTAVLVDALGRVHGPAALAVIEALGRAGDRSAEPVLVTTLSGDPANAAAAAIALGRFGRRKMALGVAARDALVGATHHADPRVRFAAAYALARETFAKSGDAATDTHAIAANAALAALLDDPGETIRAQATQALGRREGAARTHASALADRLHDRDWRVAVEAVRALAGDGGDDADRDRVAIALLRWELGVEAGERIDYEPGPAARLVDPASKLLRAVAPAPDPALDAAIVQRPSGWNLARVPASPADIHVVLEGLRALAPHATKPIVRHAIETLRRSATASQLPVLTRAWIDCLGAVALVRGSPNPDYTTMTCALPDHLKLPLIGELVSAKVGSIAQRREALRPLLAHADARVRAAGLTALAALWSEGSAADHRATAAAVVGALGSTDPLIAGTAVEAATSIYDAATSTVPGAEWRAALDAAIVARAQTEHDPELSSSLLELIGKRTLAAGAGACRAGLSGTPVRAKAAVECLAALGQAVDPPAPTSATPPPGIDVALVIGRSVRWHLATTRGDIDIELASEEAPWAVATIATLTRKGFYDGLEVHRVVPDFVVQGGDPTESGWGGPGFTIPAEPSSGAGFVEGGVGIADAGRDSGGSQWFVMHAAAPHLDGRYTWVGHVTAGLKSADALVIGDRIEHATIEIEPRP